MAADESVDERSGRGVLAEHQKNCHSADAIQSRMVTTVALTHAHEPTLAGSSYPHAVVKLETTLWRSVNPTGATSPTTLGGPSAPSLGLSTATKEPRGVRHAAEDARRARSPFARRCIPARGVARSHPAVVDH